MMIMEEGNWLYDFLAKKPRPGERSVTEPVFINLSRSPRIESGLASQYDNPI
jgi:hypothetical protein